MFNVIHQELANLDKPSRLYTFISRIGFTIIAFILYTYYELYDGMHGILELDLIGFVYIFSVILLLHICKLIDKRFYIGRV